VRQYRYKCTSRYSSYRLAATHEPQSCLSPGTEKRYEASRLVFVYCSLELVPCLASCKPFWRPRGASPDFNSKCPSRCIEIVCPSRFISAVTVYCDDCLIELMLSVWRLTRAMLEALTRYIYFVCGSLRLLPSCLLYSLFVEQLEEYVCSNWCTLSDILQTHLKALRRIYEYSLQLSIN